MTHSGSVTSTIDARGRLLVPSEVRERLGLRPGDTVVIQPDAAGMRVSNARRARADAVEGLRGSVTAAGTVDDLIADRRAQAVREAAEE